MTRTEISVAEALTRAHQALRNDLRKLEESVDSASGQDLIALCARLAATRSHITEHSTHLHGLRGVEPRRSIPGSGGARISDLEKAWGSIIR